MQHHGRNYIEKKLFNGLRYPVGKIFEDIYVTHEILYRCDKIAVVTQKMVYYYQHADSIMNLQISCREIGLS